MERKTEVLNLHFADEAIEWYVRYVPLHNHVWVFALGKESKIFVDSKVVDFPAAAQLIMEYHGKYRSEALNSFINILIGIWW